MSPYAEWIDLNVEGDGYGRCEDVCTTMQAAFPELELRKGFFFSVAWGRRQHWWLRTADGRIVDPTSLQHPDGATFPASAAQDQDLTDATDEEMRDKVPSGVCMDCGDPVYRGATFCSESCEAATMVYLDMSKGNDGVWRSGQ